MDQKHNDWYLDVKPKQKRLDTWQQGLKAYIPARYSDLENRRNTKAPVWLTHDWPVNPTVANLMIMMIWAFQAGPDALSIELFW